MKKPKQDAVTRKKAATIKTTISVPPDLMAFAVESAKSFSTFSGYIHDLIRRDLRDRKAA